MLDVMYVRFECIILIFFFIHWTTGISVQKSYKFLNLNEPETEIVEFIKSKSYLPNENDLPNAVVINKYDNSTAYILSKLSDEELIKLLHTQPKKARYDLNDVVKNALGDKFPKVDKKLGADMNTKTINGQNKAFYKLNHKELLPYQQKSNENFLALKKLHSLLYKRPEQRSMSEILSDQKKELLFDVLVAQLKNLCCRTSSKKQLSKMTDFDKFTLKYTEDNTQSKPKKLHNMNEFLFLVLNEDIKPKDNDDIILVNPESLDNNSSVLLLGPLASPLTDYELRTVIDRVSNELSKPEYTSFIQKLSDGTLNQNNFNGIKNFISGPHTRRYIKAHRCNNQSKLSKVYGGPKLLICTGYLNLNNPSLYD